MQKYPETPGSGEILLRGVENKPIDCMRLIMQQTRACPTAKINGPEDAVKLMREMGNYERERGMILHLDVKNKVIGVENIATGSLSATIIHPREAIKGAVLNSAANVIFLHNHPSGDPYPSAEDLTTDKRLQDAFDSVGIRLLDSIIIGRDSYYSAKEHGTLFQESKYKSKGEKVMEKAEDERCSVAMEAAKSVIEESCGGTHGVMEPAPHEVIMIREDDIMSTEEKIEKVESSPWARRLAEGWVTSVMSYLKPGTDEYEKAVDSMAHKVAVGLVTKAI